MQFVINGILWRVKFVRSSSRKLIRSDGSSTFGVTDARTRTVYIVNDLDDKMLRKVLCHEICHCVCFSYHVYMPIQTEEIVADWIATYGREVFYILDSIYPL